MIALEARKRIGPGSHRGEAWLTQGIAANAIFNQVYAVSINAAASAGLGRSVIVDPERIVRLQAGDGEELITDVLDLDAVTRVRHFGTAGVSRAWEQINRQGPNIDLQMYGGTIRARRLRLVAPRPHSYSS